MKNALYAPLLVFIGSGSWLGWQQIQISQLKDQVSGPIDRQEEGTSSNAEEQVPDAPYSYLDSSGNLDLEMISSATNGNLKLDGKTIHGVRAMIRLNHELQKMSAKDLIELAELVSTLDFPDDERLSLLRKIYGKLTVESPRDAIRLMSDDIDQNFRYITSALSNLAAENPREVSAWIDLHEDQIRSDSKRLSSSQSRILKIEESLAPHLLKADPDALHARMENLTPAEASILLKDISQNTQDKAFLKSVIALARRSQQSEAIVGNLVFTFVKKDLSEATKIINEFEFSKSERSAFVLQTATNIGAIQSRELTHLDGLYTWLKNEPSDQFSAYMDRAFSTSFAMNDDNPGQYERTIAKIIELGGSSPSNTMLNQFADETVCVPTCVNSLANRLKSIESPSLKKALADAHQIVSQQNSQSK